MKIGIKIMPREVILDSQGRAVEQSLQENGFDRLKSCRVGKYIELDIESSSGEESVKIAEKMLNEGGLYNPLIERFEIQNNI